MGVKEIVMQHMKSLIADLEGADKSEDSAEGEMEMEDMGDACPHCDKPMKMSKMDQLKKKANAMEE